MEAVLEAIDWQALPAKFEIYVGTLDDLYLVTVDGLIIRLGDSEKLDEKILTARSALVPLRAAYAMRGRGARCFHRRRTGRFPADVEPLRGSVNRHFFQKMGKMRFFANFFAIFRPKFAIVPCIPDGLRVKYP